MSYRSFDAQACSRWLKTKTQDEAQYLAEQKRNLGAMSEMEVIYVTNTSDAVCPICLNEISEEKIFSLKTRPLKQNPNLLLAHTICHKCKTRIQLRLPKDYNLWVCDKCGKKVETVFQPCFGQYIGKNLCRECDESLSKSRFYRLRQKSDYHLMKVMLFFAFLKNDIVKLVKRKK